MAVSVAILGASGYAGAELVRLVDGHPFLESVYLGAHSRSGSMLRDVHPQLAGGARVLGSVDPEDVPDVDVVILALPHGASALPGMEFARRGMRVIDVGSDFRMDSGHRYATAYGVRHPAPAVLSRWVYGLPELFEIGDARLVAVPGCYPTAALLALVPLVREGLIEPTNIVVDALSGVSGAGRKLSEDLLFGAVGEGVRAYGIAGHRHRHEIEMGLELADSGQARVVFTPHLVPMQRGLLATSTAPLRKGATREGLLGVLEETYRGKPFVDVIAEPPRTRWVVGSNKAMISAYVDDHTGRAIVVSAIDNLLKGAAGQALQGANLMFGLPETAGLPISGMAP